MHQRSALLLAVGALATALIGIIGYHTAVGAGQFIPRPDMAAVGIAVLLAILAVASALTAAARWRQWLPAGPVAYRGQAFVSGPAAAFIAGLLVYLVIYPPTVWVFDTMITLTFALGVMLAMPIGPGDLPAVVALLNACAGIAACVAGFATGAGILIMIGALLATSGFALALVARPVTTRPLWRVALSAFGEPGPAGLTGPAEWD